MGKAFVTYKAPKGDNQIVEVFGHRFVDGMATELDTEADARGLSKIKGYNPKYWAVTDALPRGVTLALPPEPEEEDEEEEVVAPPPRGRGIRR
jgi:hypothetical protein